MPRNGTLCRPSQSPQLRAASVLGRTDGRTDDFGYNVVKDPVHVHDLQATVLHCLGVDPERLTYRSQGRDFRLTDVGGAVVHGLLL